ASCVLYFYPYCDHYNYSCDVFYYFTRSLFLVLISVIVGVAFISSRITNDTRRFVITNSSCRSPFLYNTTKQDLICRKPKYYPTPKPFFRNLQPTLNPSCDKLFDGQHLERQRVRNAMEKLELPFDAEVIETYMDCSFVQDDFDNNFYISPDEIDFPIAYEMLIYYQKNRFLQALNLLKFIYRPHNIYCIHIDKGSPQWWINGIKCFTSCLPNVFVAKKLVKIYYGSVSILDAHLSCLSELLIVTTPWKYVLTLHSPELPLISNRDM
ncbi:PREDICTED: beta-1,3-galactosyl-O-glycosyl-glycoprotein beta-1,6-N-acetylglucosaminyltransferase 3-like, partial [Amphimedon queenslandica]|uniref:Protein xylosyltransferase n=1 Tax=Amphimedon queenslandica TaxID=400682 RepID=A0AAN0JWM3_AMPQE